MCTVEGERKRAQGQGEQRWHRRRRTCQCRRWTPRRAHCQSSCAVTGAPQKASKRSLGSLGTGPPLRYGRRGARCDMAGAERSNRVGFSLPVCADLRVGSKVFAWQTLGWGSFAFFCPLHLHETERKAFSLLPPALSPPPPPSSSGAGMPPIFLVLALAGAGVSIAVLVWRAYTEWRARAYAPLIFGVQLRSHESPKPKRSGGGGTAAAKTPETPAGSVFGFLDVFTGDFSAPSPIKVSPALKMRLESLKMSGVEEKADIKTKATPYAAAAPPATEMDEESGLVASIPAIPTSLDPAVIAAFATAAAAQEAALRAEAEMQSAEQSAAAKAAAIAAATPPPPPPEPAPAPTPAPAPSAPAAPAAAPASTPPASPPAAAAPPPAPESGRSLSQRLASRVAARVSISGGGGRRSSIRGKPRRPSTLVKPGETDEMWELY